MILCRKCSLFNPKTFECEANMDYVFVDVIECKDYEDLEFTTKLKESMKNESKISWR